MQHDHSSQSTQSDAVSKVTIFETSTMYWKLCTILLAIAFIIALASHSGPSQVVASESNQPMNALSEYESREEIVYDPWGPEACQSLSIGGFEMMDDQAMFVIVDEFGERVGMLPMNAANPD